MKRFNAIISLFVLVPLTPLAAQEKIPKTSPQVFYRETFNWGNPADPKGWTAPPGYYMEDPLDNGYNWHWWPSDSMISSKTAEPPFQSTSKADGHLCLFGALYNNYQPGGEYGQINNSIVFPTIDCSNHASVVLQFETNFRNMGSQRYVNVKGGWRTSVEISPDNGVHWTLWDASLGVITEGRPNDVAPGQVAVFRENISEVAAGQRMVRIRITWYNYFGLYFWNIDDLQLSEAPPNDLRLDKIDIQWDDRNPNTSETVSYMMPISQLGKGHSFYGFKSWISNMGATEAKNIVFDVTIKKEDITVFHEAKNIPSMMPGYKDSLALDGKYEPTQKGSYSIQYKWKQDQQDDYPEDNEKTFFYQVSDSVYNRAGDQPDYDFSFATYNYVRDEWALEANLNHFMGSVFPIYEDCEIDGISAYITGGLADGLIDFGYTVTLADWSTTVLSTWLLMKTDRLILDSTMFNTWVYLPFTKDGESEFVKAGSMLWAGLQYSNWHNTEALRRDKGISIGGTHQVPVHEAPAVGAKPSYSLGTAWQLIYTKNLMVRLYLHSTASSTEPAQSGAFSLSQNYPNPFNYQTVINYSIDREANVSLEITDLTGRVVFMKDEGIQPVGSHRAVIQGPGLSPGVYFYTLYSGQYRGTKKMVVME